MLIMFELVINTPNRALKYVHMHYGKHVVDFVFVLIVKSVSNTK